MSDNQLFQRLLPADISFYQAESPSPTKLNGIFNYIQASYYVIESYLGNGTDYEIDSGNFAERKMLHNVAGAIGQTGNLYRPINRLGSLEHIHSFYGATNRGEVPQAGTGQEGLLVPHTNYVAGDGQSTEYLDVMKEFNIPISIQSKTGDDYYLAVTFKGEGTINISDGTNLTSVALEDNPATSGADPVDGGVATYFIEASSLIVGGTFIDYINIVPAVGGLQVYSISLAAKSECHAYQNKAFNIATSMPLTQDKYWTAKAPCVHSYTNDGLCAVSTCQFCIGNTYDLYVQQSITRHGVPVCGGDYPNDVPDEMQPDPSDTAIKYTPFDPAGSVKVYSMQSSLLMTSRYFMAKYRPFAAFDPSKYAAGEPINKNETVIYDSAATYNPVNYDMIVYATSRPDIVYVSDVQADLTAPSNDRYFVIGGAYSMTQFMYDIMAQLAEFQKPTTAVYAD